MLDSLGRFWHEGQEVTNPGMCRAFFSWLRHHPDDGRFILSNGYDWTYLSVEGPPSWIEGMSATPDGFSLTLSDGSRQPLASPMWLDADGALNVRVSGKPRLYARFRPRVQAGLGEWLTERDGNFFVHLDGFSWPVLPTPPDDQV